MTKSLLCLCFILTDLTLQAQPPRLYLYLVSHNEDNIGYLNGASGKMSYLNARNVLVNIGNMVQAKNLAYNYGADWVALKAIAQNDTGIVLANTNNKNLVKWLVEDKQVACDPHSHESTYNYGDVAYLMSLLGVTPSRVMSGYLYNQLQNGHSWGNYQNGAQGDSFSFYTWHPEIKWGAGSPNHVADLNMFGVYRPKSMSQFTTHEPGNHLIFCGTGCALKLKDTATVDYKFNQIKQIANDIYNGVLPSNGIYMQEIFFSEGDIKKAWFFPMLNALTDSLATLVSAGKAEWKTIEEIVDEWKADFNNQPFAVNCDYTVVLNPMSVPETGFAPAFKIYPNPASDFIKIETGSIQQTGLTITNSVGQIMIRKEVSHDLQVDIKALSDGLYFLRIGNHLTSFIKQSD